MEPHKQSEKYNPFQDASFWSAFLLGGGVSVPFMELNGLFFEPPAILNLIFLISWTGWIIFKKGKKGSLLIGFLFAIIVTAIFFPLMLKIEIRKMEAERREFIEEYMGDDLNAEQRKFMEEYIENMN